MKRRGKSPLSYFGFMDEIKDAICSTPSNVDGIFSWLGIMFEKITSSNFTRRSGVLSFIFRE